MKKLFGNLNSTNVEFPLPHSVWKITREDSALEVLRLEDPFMELHKPILISKGEFERSESQVIFLESDLHYLGAGDVVAFSDDGKRISVLWRHDSPNNSFLLTERCDNYCLMCSQPPKEGNDDWLLQRTIEALKIIDTEPAVIGITGGEPTIYNENFIDLVKFMAVKFPNTGIHILSNGRRFSDFDFSVAYSEATSTNTMIGIPIYGTTASQHDYVVQAKGAFEETINGILNLGELGQSIEIRVVIHKQTAGQLLEIAEFISRNLPFVDQVALMGLEIMGLARGNIAELWIDPIDYQEELRQAVLLLAHRGLKVMIYNHQLCLLPLDIWSFAVQSISDWKNEYDSLCDQCEIKEHCGGFFHSAKYASSAHIRPMRTDGTFLDTEVKNVSLSEKPWKRRLIPFVVENENFS